MTLIVDLSIPGFLHHLFAFLLSSFMHVIAEALKFIMLLLIVVRKYSETDWLSRIISIDIFKCV
jgi:hypothetical protein